MGYKSYMIQTMRFFKKSFFNICTLQLVHCIKNKLGINFYNNATCMHTTEHQLFYASSPVPGLEKLKIK